MMRKITITLLFIICITIVTHAQMRPFDINRHAKTIEEFRRTDRKTTLPNNPYVLFVGSSSIVLWPTAEAFSGINVINRGFGGASVLEINHFYTDVIGRYDPQAIVLYSDIEIENGATPDQAIASYKTLLSRIKADFPAATIFLLSMKPTLVDDKLGLDVRRNKQTANDMLAKIAASDKQFVFVDVCALMMDGKGNLREDIFLSDGLHLNEKGYELWKEVMSEQFEKYVIPSEK